MEFELSQKTLHFKKPARTSRGEYTEHKMTLVTIRDGNCCAIGECAPLPDLSYDRNAYDRPEDVRRIITEASAGCKDIDEVSKRIPVSLGRYPALLFAMESAIAELRKDPHLYDTPFARGENGIPINGLIWMADYEGMLSQVEAKIASGCRCIKLKIGAIGWEDEIRLIRLIRERFDASELQLRVDANGAFGHSDVLQKLDELATYDIHSIEQPIRQGNWDFMSRLCRESPIPIALDEELIDVIDAEDRKRMLEIIMPQYIVVKPSLHGGLSGAREWISEAAKLGISSWITSALESNIGLRHIALLAADIYDINPGTVTVTMPQGLGTGLLFEDNIDNGIVFKDGSVWISE